MLAFIQNRATNVMPLILGLFFKIRGTSVHIINMLSNAGISVPFNTIERLKSIISDDAIAHAVTLLTSGNPFFHMTSNVDVAAVAVHATNGTSCLVYIRSSLSFDSVAETRPLPIRLYSAPHQ